MKAKDMQNTCVICGKNFVGYGNNPSPIMEHGVCCNECNETKVIPERLRRMGYTLPTWVRMR